MTTLNVTKRTIVCSRKGSEMVENENEKNMQRLSLESKVKRQIENGLEE